MQQNPELENLLNCCHESSEFVEYLYFDEETMFAQFIFNQPFPGKDYAIEVNIYLRYSRSVVQILFGRAEIDDVEELIANYMFMSPHVIRTVTWFTEETQEIHIATCVNAHC